MDADLNSSPVIPHPIAVHALYSAALLGVAWILAGAYSSVNTPGVAVEPVSPPVTVVWWPSPGGAGQ